MFPGVDMRNKYLYLPALFCLWMFSCASPKPDDETLLRYVRSMDVYREGRFTEAAAMLKGETKFTPALVLRGKAEYLSGDLKGAGLSLNRALAINPHDTEASLFLARVSRESGKIGEAQKLIDNILGDNPMEIRALRLAAELARERGANGEAAAAALLDRAVEASAEAALVFLDRARLRWAGGNRSGALEDLGHAKVLLPHDSPVMRALERLESIIQEVS